jgi:hypothetical protein
MTIAIAHPVNATKVNTTKATQLGRVDYLVTG